MILALLDDTTAIDEEGNVYARASSVARWFRAEGGYRPEPRELAAIELARLAFERATCDHPAAVPSDEWNDEGARLLECAVCGSIDVPEPA